MTNDYIFIELNKRGEFIAKSSLVLWNVRYSTDVKIDTGCANTVVNTARLAIPTSQAQILKKQDSVNQAIRKHITFGVNDSKEKQAQD